MVKKMEAITNWPITVTVTDVRSFLGFTYYYRQFIPKYSHIVRPLNVLTSGENASQKNKMVDWNDEYQQAFNKLSGLCTDTPVLAFVDYGKPFKVHSYASALGVELCCIRLIGMDLIGQLIMPAELSSKVKGSTLQTN